MIHKVLFYVYVNNIEKSKARLERKIKAVLAEKTRGITGNSDITALAP